MEKNDKETGGGCSCQKCQGCQNCQGCMGHCHSSHKYFVLRWVLGLLIIFMVFWLGMKIGEFRGYYESDFGGSRGFHRGMMYNQGFYPANANASTTTPATPITPTKK